LTLPLACGIWSHWQFLANVKVSETNDLM